MSDRFEKLILGLDSSGTTGGAALLDQRTVVASVSFTSKTLYSQRLLPSIQWLLEKANAATSDIQGIAVARGPGSFTGLRIGLSAAKALAFAIGCPVVGVSTLRAIALRAALFEGRVCALMDARQGEVYAALYRVKARTPPIDSVLSQAAMPILDEVRREYAGKLDEIMEWFDQPTVFAGEGAFRYEEKLRALGEKFILAPSIRALPSAEEVAWLGMQRLSAGEQDDLMLLEPEYLRRTYAEVKKKA